MMIINILEVDAKAFCSTFEGVFQIFGYVYLFIKIITPIMLLVVGMISMTKAIAGKDDEAIKKAQKGLVKKAIAAVSVFLVATLVGLLMNIIGGSPYEQCTTCINNPTSCSSGSVTNTAPGKVSGYTCGGSKTGTCPSYQKCIKQDGFYQCVNK